MIPGMGSDYCRNTWDMQALIPQLDIEKSQALNIASGTTIFGIIVIRSQFTYLLPSNKRRDVCPFMRTYAGFNDSIKGLPLQEK